MANTLDPMDLKQIISLQKDGLSNRQIGKTLGIGRNCVNAYMALFRASEVPLTELLSMDNHSLQELFPSTTTINNDRYNELMQYFEKVNAARNHPGFTFLYHYAEYSNQAKQPYGYTQFMEHYHRRYDKIKGSMKLEHEAGKEVFIDFAGTKLHIINRETGELIPCEVFVAILPNSHYTYVEACLSQRREDLISCMGNALNFFGGVPKAIVSDNLKSAVSRSSKYEPDINRSFKDFAQHYNCVINPTRAYSPQDKALVENAVYLAYQRIYYPMREMRFFSLKDLNEEIQNRLKHYNSFLFKRKEASRTELFQSVERGYLKALPLSPYELKGYTRAKAQKMGYVYFSADKSYYSVPYRYIGKMTQIHYTQSVIEVYYNNERIALHKRNMARGMYNTEQEHLSSTHKFFSEWSPDYFSRQASKHGKHVQMFVDALFASNDYPEPIYKRAMGIIQLGRIYGSDRLDNACLRASYGDTYSYNRVKNILERNLDKENFDIQELERNISHIPPHNNTRGRTAFN